MQKINERPKRAVPRLPQRDPVRLTALLYLREALLAERYEECDEIIAIALEFGATTVDIHYLLEDPRRRPVG